MSLVALRLVEPKGFSREEVDLSTVGFDDAGHSLHSVLSDAGGFSPALAAFCIERFSKPEQVIFDPFAGFGVVPLEAALRGRLVAAGDHDPLAARVIAAKLEPADLAEVTLWLQHANLKRPVPLDPKFFRETFAPFYDINTFRELLALKLHLSEDSSRIGRFVQLLALGLLHGHSAGYLSAYSLPQVALTPKEQLDLNAKRRQSPDYRALTQRVIRKAATVLADGDLGVVARHRDKNKSFVANAQRVPCSAQSVDLVLTSPPLPGVRKKPHPRWLEHWFSFGVTDREPPPQEFKGLQDWLDFMNECLLEWARVTRSMRRVVLDLRALRVAGKLVQLEAVLAELVNTDFGRFFEVEASLVVSQKVRKLQSAGQPIAGERDEARLSQQHRLLVLRRK